MKREYKLIANNKKAMHDYFIDDTYEAGIVLTGTEIKSIRRGKASIKEKIPVGKVASYGQIAQMIGLPTHSRLVGRALSLSRLYGDYPCHRVVNYAGALSASFTWQRKLLETEIGRAHV